MKLDWTIIYDKYRYSGDYKKIDLYPSSVYVIGNIYEINVEDFICCPDVYCWNLRAQNKFQYGHWQFSARQSGFHSIEDAILDVEEFLRYNIDRIKKEEEEWAKQLCGENDGKNQ